MNVRFSLRLALLVLRALALAAFPGSIGAQMLWNGGGANELWSTAANWHSGNVPAINSTTSTITFSGSTNLVPDINQNWSVGTITFSSSTSSFTLASAEGKTLTIYGGFTNSSSSTQSVSSAVVIASDQTWLADSGNLNFSGPIATNGNDLTIDGPNNTAISGAISGGNSSAYIYKNGAGTLTLSGNNSFSNSLTVNAGTVLATSNTALGSGAFATVISGATLAFQNNVSVNESGLTIAGSGVAGAGAIQNVSGNNTLNDQISLTGAATISSASGTLTLGSPISTESFGLTVAGAGNTTLTGQVGGNGSLTTNSSGVVNLQTETLSGPVTAGGHGTVNFNQGSTGSSSITVTNTGTTTFGAAASTSGNVLVSNGATTFNGALNAGATVAVSSTGPTVFNGTVTASGSSPLTVTGPGNVSFNGSMVNAGGGLTIAGSGSVTAASTLNLGSGILTISGSGSTILSGAQINASSVSITGIGTQVIYSAINTTGNLSISGSGTTILAGTASNNISGTSYITGGTVVLGKSSGNALGSSVSVSGSGNLSFAGNNQLTAWTNLTLGAGGTLTLNGTSQSINSLTVTGNSVIDFGNGSSSTLSIASLTLTGKATLTVENWNQSVDSFYANVNPGSSSLASIVFQPGNQTAGWTSSTGKIAPTPEPSFYGLICVGSVVAAWWICRHRKARSLQRRGMVACGQGVNHLERELSERR